MTCPAGTHERSAALYATTPRKGRPGWRVTRYTRRSVSLRLSNATNAERDSKRAAHGSACDYFKMRHRWRVQATWTYDGEPKSYSPIFTRTRTGAARQRRNIERTLWHFPTLDVKVERVSLQAAKVEMDRRAAALLDWVPEPVHLVSDMTAQTTACGRNVERVDNRSVPEVFAVSSRQCPDCATAESSRVQ